ncbi:uncharacterized protein [Argopecten irradians]|uniref:uncharacterized protein n=1 Tax=Argopecten irradians TaxID=31199 RepID=UPI003712053A
MDNTNNNQIFDGAEEEDGWPNDVFGFLRGERSCGLNLWVTFLEDKVRLNDGTENHDNCPEETKLVKPEVELYQEDFSPYVRLFADDDSEWGIYHGMPEAWRT